MDPVERYLTELRDQHLSGAGVAETSGYPAIKELFDAIGKGLKPKVRCIIHLRGQGAGIPDGGLFTADQFPRATDSPREGQLPAVAALEVKSVPEDLTSTLAGEQVLKYVRRYGQVLVTNYRDFVLVVRARDGSAHRADSFSLGKTPAEFWQYAAQPRKSAAEQGPRFVEFLSRVLRSRVTLSEPEDVAWFLASYARDAMDAVGHQEIPTLDSVRSALEEALGIEFKGEKGDHFFRSSLIQTLFYGIFSGWVLWSREHSAGDTTPFDWRSAAWHLKVPMINSLFEQIAQPGPIEELGLKLILDRTAEVLNRVDRTAFFQRFQDAEAVQYFYEPFLEAFDPQLRKELGVWYTPQEVVKYMVARVDSVLKSELGIERGLADKSVYVLDPCCGTGAYLVEVLETIAKTLKDEGGDALLASDLRTAARERVFGFELLPAPFVVSHLQLGLLLHRLGAPLGSGAGDRAAVFLTNALTGWGVEQEEKPIPFPGMEEERGQSDAVKRSKPILVILGNPPYNGYAGMAVAEERDLSDAYRATVAAPKPQGQGLNDLYVRFFRMAERKIVEHTGQGVICFISNYSWLDGLSFTGMRERYLQKFDRIWIDCLNGDAFKTGKLTPSGEPDPSIFSTDNNKEGIRIGTAISLLVRKTECVDDKTLKYRSLWGKEKREQLLAEATGEQIPTWQRVTPELALGLPFVPISVSEGYANWPSLTALLPKSSPGVKTSRDADLVSIDLQRLQGRLGTYFDPSSGNDLLLQVAPGLFKGSDRFDPEATRRALLGMGIESGRFVPFTYRPFDVRWVYWHPKTKLIDEKREDLFSWIESGTRVFTSRQKAERTSEGSPFFVSRALPDWHLTRPGCICFPISVPDTEGHDRLGISSSMSNLSSHARGYLRALGNPSGSIWFHTLAIGHSPKYLLENASGLGQDYPRIPLPVDAAAFQASSELGAQVADLLDTAIPVSGVSVGKLAKILADVGLLATVDNRPVDPDQGHLAVTSGWGHAGRNGVTMPGAGRILERPDGAVDIYLNDRVFWSNVPRAVWEYTLGGYQVVKKWLSYREKSLLGRDLTVDEARYVSEMLRRIAAILALGPLLDANYERVKAESYAWPT